MSSEELRDALDALPGLNAPGPDGQWRHWKPWDGIEEALAAQPAAGEGLDVEALVRRLDSAKRRGPLTADMIPFNMGVAAAQDVLRVALQPASEENR